MKKSYTLRKAILAFSFLFTSAIAGAQCLTCGTGADGAYHATANTTLAGGTYNYTSFTIDPNIYVLITGPAPLVIHCSDPVLINGILNASGSNGTNGATNDSAGTGGVGVAGGYDGGDGIYSVASGPLNGSPGVGLGTGGAGMAWSGGGGAGYETAGDSSGNPAGGYGGPAYSNAQLSPYTGGSGGGGGSGGYSCGSGGGGAGGGIIEIHSCTSITIGINASILSNGGNGGSDGGGNCGGGGGGSGGTVWFLTTGTFTNNGTVAAIPGIGGASNVPASPYYGTGANGKNGRIRADYATFAGTGSMNPLLGYTAMPFSVSNTHTDETTVSSNDGTATAIPQNGTPPYTYLWMPGSQTTATITGLNAGTYTCTITDLSGCADTTIVTVDIMSGINTMNAAVFAVDVFPNPAGDHVQIAVSLGQKNNVSLEVYNLLGEQIDAVAFNNVNAVNHSYNTGTLENGIYLFRVSAGGITTTKKITVSH